MIESSGSCAAELPCGEACETQCTATEEREGGRLRNRRRDWRPDESCGKCVRPRSRSAEAEISDGVGKAGSRKSGDAGEIQRAANGRLGETIKSYGQRTEEKSGAVRDVGIVRDVWRAAGEAQVVGENGRKGSRLGPHPGQEGHG